MAADLVFIDTNVLVAASVEGHPSHAVATMRAHGVSMLATLNWSDLRRFDEPIAPSPIAS